ncbi:MAG: phytanoyl-CoA dioxygenase family protein, partial [Candidatus Poribacteria bacterium]|nr:phytanoyl-CoA dioxygenase family protein [Candidatus Poribacteria bacterium]
MPISDDYRFTFDVQGYLHLRGALTPDEVAEYTRWMDEVEGVDVEAVNADDPEARKHQLNRPVSRVFDADPRFCRFLDHPVTEPYLIEFLGENYKHIDNEVYYTHPDYKGGGWHRGVSTHSTGHVREGAFICPMVKIFYCLTDVGPNEGEFEVV